MTITRSARQEMKWGLAGIVLAVSYFFTARFGLVFAIHPGNATAVWPPSGLALVAVLLLGRRVSFGVLVGATLATMATGATLPVSLAIGIGNTLEALVGAQLIRLLIGSKTEFRRSKHAFFFLLAAAGSCAIAATVGVTSLLLGDLIVADQFVSNWSTWWLGDTAGIMVVAPLLLAWVHHEEESPKRSSWMKFLPAMFLLSAASCTIFCGVLSDHLSTNLLCLPLLLLIWLALQFDFREVTLATAVFSVTAIWGTLHGMGAFAGAEIGESLLSLQIFMIIYAMTGLALAGMVASQRDAEMALRISHDQLEDRVNERTLELVRTNKTLRREIKDREFVEQTLGESELRFRTLFEQAGEVILLIDHDGQLIDANEQACSILGYSRVELLNLKVSDIEPTCSRESHSKFLAGLEYGVPAIIEGTYRRKDGSAMPVEIRIGLVEVEGGMHALCLARDISDRRRAEQAERLRQTTVLQAIGESIVITDSDGLIQYVNPAFEDITGWNRSEVNGNNPRIFQSGMHDQELYRDMWQTITMGNVWKGSLVDKKKDGTLYDVDATIAPIIDDNGSVTGYVAVNRDVTERIRSEKALRESEARISAIVGSAVDGIITIDEQGVIESCNSAAVGIFSYPQTELVGKAASELLHLNGDHGDSESFQKYVCRTAKKMTGGTREVLATRKDGSTFPADLSVSEVLLHDRRLFTGIVRDVTERHTRLAAEKRILANQQEMQVARSIQQRFFPSNSPMIEGFDIAGASWPADDTGGDYFDFLQFPNGHFGVVVADASGHGLGAALLMSETRAYLRALLSTCRDVAELVTRLNSFLCDDCGYEKFVTLFLAQIDLVETSFVYAGAGHQCYLFRQNGKVEFLKATGIPLGFMAQEVSSSPRITLDEGDLLLLLTDGFEETVSPEDREYGTERVLALIEETRHKPAKEIVENLKNVVKSYAQGAPQHDDVTAVVVKVEKV